MADEVVDIRKRIEEMRNEVSAAIVSNRDLYEASRALGNHADITMNPTDDAASSPDSATAGQSVPSASTLDAFKSLQSALKMPAFRLMYTTRFLIACCYHGWRPNCDEYHPHRHFLVKLG